MNSSCSLCWSVIWQSFSVVVWSTHVVLSVIVTVLFGNTIEVVKGNKVVALVNSIKVVVSTKELLVLVDSIDVVVLGNTIEVVLGNERVVLTIKIVVLVGVAVVVVVGVVKVDSVGFKY